LLLPLALPFGFDQMEWVLPASRCHKRANIAKNKP
jgi:hypothetical protein